jgi:hypothetical protein
LVDATPQSLSILSLGSDDRQEETGGKRTSGVMRETWALSYNLRLAASRRAACVESEPQILAILTTLASPWKESRNRSGQHVYRSSAIASLMSKSLNWIPQ